MNRFCHILKRSWNWIVWKLQMSCRWILWHNKPHKKTQKRPNQLVTTEKNQVTTKTGAVNSNETKTRPKTTQLVPPTTTRALITVVRQTLTPTKRFSTTEPQLIQKIKQSENQDLSTHLVRPVVKLTIPRRNVTFEQTQLIDRLPGTNGRKEKIRSNKERPKTIQMQILKLQPKL